MKPTKNNTLRLSIKREDYYAIISGKKKTELRKIKDTTFTKYLATWHEDDQIGLYYDKHLLSSEPISEIYLYNDGVYPYIPIEYKFLSLAARNNDELDIIVVEVNDISFQLALQNNGFPIRFEIIDGSFTPSKNGDYCFWNIAYHLGKVIEIKQKKSGIGQMNI